MLTKVITKTEEFYELESDWISLQEKDPDVTFYSTFEYVKAWWNVYKEDKDKQLFIVCVYQNQDIVGIGPFIIEKERKKFLKWKVLRFIGIGDFFGLLVNRSINSDMTIVRDIFNCINNSKDLWDRLNLTHVKDNSLITTFLLKQTKYNDNLKYLIECPRLHLTKYCSFEEYKTIHISSSAKKYRNKLERECNYHFKVIKNDEYNNVFNDISMLHIANQEFLIHEEGKLERRSLYKDKKINKFLSDFYSKSENIVTFMLFDESNELIIYDTCYIYKNTIHSWNTAYNPKFIKYNVGRIMYYEIMQYVFNNNLAEIFDFGAGRYPWKFEWTNDFALVYQLDVWNESTKKGRLLMKLFKTMKRVYGK